MRLWRNQAFVVFWSARTISFAGTGITMVVLPVLVYGMTGSPAWVASPGLIEAVPYLSFGLLAGAEALPIRLTLGLLAISAVVGAGLAGWSCLGSRPLAAVSMPTAAVPA